MGPYKVYSYAMCVEERIQQAIWDQEELDEYDWYLEALINEYASNTDDEELEE